MEPPREEEITDAVAAYLRPRWRIVATHHPGSSGGLRLQAEAGAAPEGLSDVIPDVLAVRGDTVLLVESKPRYSPRDERKLRSVVSSGAYLGAACRAAGLPASTKLSLVPALAFCAQESDPSAAGFVVFHYALGKVVVAQGRELLDTP